MKINKITFILLILLLLSTFIAIFLTPCWGDEKYYHYPNVANISVSNIIDRNSSYSSAYTPLPYVLGSILYEINDSIYLLRILNYLILLILIIYFYKISLGLRNDPLVLVLLLVSNPYLLRNSFVYYSGNYGLLFAVIGIYFYFFSIKKSKIIVAHIFWGLSILCQQWMLIIIFSIFLHELNQLIKNKLDYAFFLRGILYKSLSLLPAIILFLFWGGLTHPNFQQHKLTPSFIHLTGVLANYGLIGTFIVMFNLKKFLKSQYLLLLFFLPIIYFSVPAHSEIQGTNVITGVASQLCTQLQKYLQFPYEISMFLLAAAGMMLVVVIISKANDNFSSFLQYTILGFLVAFSSSTVLGATHIFISVPFIFLIFNSELREKKLLENLVLTFFYLVSLFYIFYFSLYKTSGFNL
ncbi:MAG: hypothetical protein IPM51_00200 [Sphingobacteriaceae bacterium]|nr:hypothetical protein [Sphingobacteriaceae bacterium]